MSAYLTLINHLYQLHIIQSPTILNAFNHVCRSLFVPKDQLDHIGEDRPISIGFGQTNSQPRTVALMLEWLMPKQDQTILDIGSGSGWTTALLASIVGKNGRVIGLERVPDLVSFGQVNLNKLSFTHASIQLASSSLGIPNQTFDRILVSATADSFPDDLIKQLNPNGILVIPVKNDIIRVKKCDDGTLLRDTYSGFRFVPLIF